MVSQMFAKYWKGILQTHWLWSVGSTCWYVVFLQLDHKWGCMGTLSKDNRFVCCLQAKFPQFLQWSAFKAPDIQVIQMDDESEVNSREDQRFCSDRSSKGLRSGLFAFCLPGYWFIWKKGANICKYDSSWQSIPLKETVLAQFLAPWCHHACWFGQETDLILVSFCSCSSAPKALQQSSFQRGRSPDSIAHSWLHFHEKLHAPYIYIYPYVSYILYTSITYHDIL